MEMSPPVSVCIISYNQVEYISAAIEGCLNQITDFRYEILISDDCSTDGTERIIEDYRKKYPNIIRVLTNTQNVGLLRNFDRAIRACQGEFIGYCEGDDIWIDQHKIQEQYTLLCSNPSISYVSGSWTDFHVTKHLYTQRPYTGLTITNENTDPFSLERLNPHGSLSLRFSTIFFRKSMVIEILDSEYDLFHNPKFIANDYSLQMELLKRGGDIFIDRPLAIYNQRDESVSISVNPLRHFLYSLGTASGKAFLFAKYNVHPNIVQKYFRHSITNLYLSIIELKQFEKLHDLQQLVQLLEYKMTLSQKVLRWSANKGWLGKCFVALRRIMLKIFR